MKGRFFTLAAIGLVCGVGNAASSLQQTETLLAAGKPAEALMVIESQLATQPNQQHWLFLNARALVAAGQNAKAINAYQTLIKQHPRLIEAYNNLAVLHARQGDMEQAGKVLEQALTATNPAYATVYENLQAVYVEMTRDSYGKALRLDVPKRQVNLKELMLASVKVKDTPRLATSESPQTAARVQQSVTPETGAAKSQISETPATAADEEITTTLQGWATAWSAQEVELYLSFYGQAFRPPYGQSRQTWERVRERRLRKPKWIKVTLDDIRVNSKTDGQAHVQLLQQYRSNNYEDLTRKEFVLQRSDEGWRIVAEYSR